MKTRKYIALLLLVISVFVCSVPVLADNYRGDTVSLNVTISGSYSDVKGIGVDISYDSSVLELLGGSWKLSGTGSVDAGKNKAAIMFTDAVTVQGTILTLNFKVKADAKFGPAAVRAAVSIKPEGASQTVTAGTITVVCKHSYSESTAVDGEKHSHTCSICGTSESLAHTWNSGEVTKAPTCQESGEKVLTCQTCGYKKTETLPADGSHKWGAATKVSDSQHSRTCSVCGKTENVSHNWDGGTVIKAATCKDNGEKRLACRDCGFARAEAIPKTEDHKYSGGTDLGDGKHEQTCSVCGDKKSAAHTAGESWFSDESSHWKVCTVCGAKVELSIHAACPDCGYEATPGEHQHHFEERLSSDREQHWYACIGCEEKKDAEAHVYDDNCDPECNVCGSLRIPPHSYSERLLSDSASHWYECSNCHLIREKAPHTETEDRICPECGYEAPEKVPETTAAESTSAVEDTTAPEETEAPEQKPAKNGSGLFQGNWIFIGVGALALLLCFAGERLYSRTRK